nr:ribonuclease H-like domain-containing protein [Tanacetum cinerariifolium]
MFSALGRLMDDIHMTWAHLDKKGTRLQLYAEVVSRIAHRAWRRRHNFLATPSDHTRDDVRKLITAPKCNRLKRNPSRLSKAKALENLRCLKKDATARKIALLSKVKKKLRITFNLHLTFTFNSQKEIDQQYPTIAKIPALDTGKFEQWQFWIQQYLQHEHYAMWEVIEFGDSYTVPVNSPSTTTTDTTSGDAGTKLQVIIGQLQFMDVEIKQDDLNQKFLTSLALEWLMHTIVWRNRSDLDTISLDDLYNHLKIYESEVQKKSEPNSQNMAFISSAKHSSGNEDGNTACVPTTSTNVPTASASVATISQDSACAYIASQSSGSQIKFKDINQIDEDDMKEMDIKWNMALLNMRADKFWKMTGKKISIQGSDVAGFDKSKAPKALMVIDRVGWDWSYMANDEEDHALVTDEVAPTEFALMANISAESKTLKEEKEGVDGKLASLLKASKDIDNLIESQRTYKIKDGLGYIDVPPPPAQLYLSPKKDLSWTGISECADDIVTAYSRPLLTVESTSGDDQNRNPSVYETVASPITPKPFIKFVKPKDSQSKSKSGKTKSPKKPPVKYAEQYRKPNKKRNVRGNQRNWNNLKTRQLGPDFVMKKKACFNCGDFNHLAYDCRKRAHSYANRPIHRTSAVRSPHKAPWVPTVNRNFPPVNRKFSPSSRNFPTANRKFPTTSRKFPTGSTKSSTANMRMKGKAGSSQNNIDDKGYWDSDCSRHMTSNISHLSDYEPFDGGYVSFGQGGCKIIGKGTIKTGKLKFENVYFVKDIKYNLFSVSQICDNKNSVLFTDSECIVLGRDFKLLDDANIFLSTPRQHNMYSIDLNNIVPHRDLTCLVAKSSADECLHGLSFSNLRMRLVAFLRSSLLK